MGEIAEQQIVDVICTYKNKDCVTCQLSRDCLIHNKMVPAILALIEQKQKPMVEALREARRLLSYVDEDDSPSAPKVLAKIDAVLPKGEGK